MPWKYARHAEPAKKYDQIDLVLENTSLGLGTDGKEQSRQLALAQPQFQTILHSPFARAKETAAIVYETQGAAAQLMELPELEEVRFGTPNRESLKEWIATGKSAGGEKVQHVRERVRYVMERTRIFGDVHGLMVAHKLLYSVFLLELESLPLDTPVAALSANKKLDYAECVELPL